MSILFCTIFSKISFACNKLFNFGIIITFFYHFCNLKVLILSIKTCTFLFLSKFTIYFCNSPLFLFSWILWNEKVNSSFNIYNKNLVLLFSCFINSVKKKISRKFYKTFGIIGPVSLREPRFPNSSKMSPRLWLVFCLSGSLYFIGFLFGPLST